MHHSPCLRCLYLTFFPPSNALNNQQQYNTLSYPSSFQSICLPVFVSEKLCIKFEQLRHLPEASTIQFIADHTLTPVPKMYCAKGWTYITMERLEGEMVGLNWARHSHNRRNSGRDAEYMSFSWTRRL